MTHMTHARKPFQRMNFILCCLPMLFLSGLTAFPQQKAVPMTPAEKSIRHVLDEQVEAWNRGDVDSFVTGYADSSATLFVGKEMARGYAAIADRYKQNYPTRQKMGKLSFTDLEVHQLDQDYAAVVGRYHLERTTTGGGNADGIFSLIFDKTSQGWKIVLDHSS